MFGFDSQRAPQPPAAGPGPVRGKVAAACCRQPRCLCPLPGNPATGRRPVRTRTDHSESCPSRLPALRTAADSLGHSGPAWEVPELVPPPGTKIWIAQAQKQLPGLAGLAARFLTLVSQEPIFHITSNIVSVLKPQQSYRLYLLVRDIQALNSTREKYLLLKCKYVSFSTIC